MDSLSSITVPMIKNYLCLQGWKINEKFPNRKIILFQKDEFDLTIPINEAFKDYLSRLNDMIETLSIINNEPLNKIIDDILAVNLDRLEFRFVSESSQNGKLPLAYASQCFAALKNLIVSSACAERTLSPKCSRISKSDTSKLDKFQLAQSKVGSYIINIDTQIICSEVNHDSLEQTILAPKENTLMNTFWEDSSEHKIVRRINKSIEQVDDIVTNKISISEAIEKAYETGITANICDALLELRSEKEDTQIFANFYYATGLGENNNQHPLLLSDNHFYVIDDIAKRYRDEQTYVDVTLRGQINLLKRTKENTIKLLTEIDNQSRNVLVDLSNEDYVLACDAHKESKQVQLTGLLDKSERTWKITDVISFSVL